jgi:uncharacterized protein
MHDDSEENNSGNGPEDLDHPPSFFPYGDDALAEERGRDGWPGVHVAVQAVFSTRTSEGDQFFVLLSDGHYKLPIMIGQFEATSITIALEGHKPDRPMTHDLTTNLITRLGAKVLRVLIDDLWGTTYYAKIIIESQGETMSVDSRPSDAIALALRSDASIFVRQQILHSQGN